MTTSVFNLYNSFILLALILAILCALLCLEIELELIVETEDMTCCGLNRNVPRKIIWLNNWSPNDDTPREVCRTFGIQSFVGGNRLLKSES